MLNSERRRNLKNCFLRVFAALLLLEIFVAAQQNRTQIVPLVSNVTFGGPAQNEDFGLEHLPGIPMTGINSEHRQSGMWRSSRHSFTTELSRDLRMRFDITLM
jgi:hypothetical protein